MQSAAGGEALQQHFTHAAGAGCASLAIHCQYLQPQKEWEAADCYYISNERWKHLISLFQLLISAEKKSVPERKKWVVGYSEQDRLQ